MILHDRQGATMFVTFEPSKLTEEVKTHLPDATKLLAARKATSLGMTMSEYLRDLICLDNHGTSYDELMMAHRRALRTGAQGPTVAQPQPSTGPDAAPYRVKS